jgi:protein-disulfide isomerase
MARANWTERLNTVVNVTVLAFVLFVLFRPGGVVGAEVGKWRKSSAEKKSLAAVWPQLTSTGARLGDAGSGRVVVEFSDYQCPFCRKAHGKLPEMLREAGATLVYRHLPLTQIHPEAEGAARASICAEGQGQFEPMHRHLFETEGWYEPGTDWVAEAAAAGIADTTRFRACMDDPATSRRLEQDIALAERLGIKATPAFVSTGGVHTGMADAEDLERILP